MDKWMAQQERMRPVYREVQQFRQAWIWAVVIAIVGLIWVAGVRQLILDRPFGGQPMPDILLVIFWLLFGIGLPALFLFCRLVTEVRNDGIYIRFSPFHLSFRRIGFEELKGYDVRAYRPIREYGGSGIRSGSKGKAYNVSGNRGVQLVLTNGRRLLLGSQRPEEFWQAIHEGARRR
jgi:hypothetical protein